MYSSLIFAKLLFFPRSNIISTVRGVDQDVLYIFWWNFTSDFTEAVAKIEVQFLKSENKSKYSCSLDIFYPPDRFRIQVPVKSASERDLTDDDQRIKNFC